ncbi:MAG TPA: hypothetical protein VMD59_08585, partial [Acidimicrobiales bacterium]|nr:hypothetical protein [Acidimicrobiales bacterium]
MPYPHSQAGTAAEGGGDGCDGHRDGAGGGGTRARAPGGDRGTKRRSTAFDEHQAAMLAEHGEGHWWFRAKAAWVSSVLEPACSSARLVDVGAGLGGVTRQLRFAGHKIVVEPSAALARTSPGLTFVR